MTGKLDKQRPFFALSERVYCFPVLHGSADFALAIKEELLREHYDCVAVPLPPSFQEEVEAAIVDLPQVSVVTQSSTDDQSCHTYVPIDPCQAVIRALQMARQERSQRAFIDMEVRDYESESGAFPDAYALKTVSPHQYAAAILAAIPAPIPASQQDQRVRHMAFETHKLELDFERILVIVNLLDWPWYRDAYNKKLPYPKLPSYYAAIDTYAVDPNTLSFVMGELPFITSMYDRFRYGIDEETSLGVDGIKELVVEARDRCLKDKPRLKSRLNTKTLSIYFQYLRNLTLMRRRLTPDMITMVETAQQMFGDDFAIELLKTAREYKPQEHVTGPLFRFAPDRLAEHPLCGQTQVINRLPGREMVWKSIDLKPEPELPEKEKWSQVWNPYSQCSWPPEDSRIESFNLHVREQAKNILTSEFAKTEKFSSSMKDGLDIRETLRNWHTGDLYVKENPPARGSVEIVVFLFDVPADPNEYQWQTTWFAEHQNESTLVFFATEFGANIIGPGIAEATYGGAFFLYPPRPIPDIWTDPRIADTKTLEERLLAGAFMHSRERHVAVVSPCSPKSSWRQLARRFGKKIIHLPLGRFSAQTVERLRQFHVLNGQDVRSYAAEYIRRTE